MLTRRKLRRYLEDNIRILVDQKGGQAGSQIEYMYAVISVPIDDWCSPLPTKGEYKKMIIDKIMKEL